MIRLGEYNELKIDRDTDQGFYLVDDQGEDVLLPNKYIPEDKNVGDHIEVFVYKDSEDRLISTTLKPYAILEEFAELEILNVNKFGAFADWGIAKDLFIPFYEQHKKLQAGEKHLVFIFIDEETDRLVGSTKIDHHLETEEILITQDEEVDLVVWKRTDLGYKVIINRLYPGLIFHSNVDQDLHRGQKLKGFIGQIRSDKKIDILLKPKGFENRIKSDTDMILSMLNSQNGVIEIGDKSSPDQIMGTFKMSKKAFKKAAGQLYKDKKIKIEANRITINQPQ